ncbi:riboflavin biosynthesis protein RibD [Ammoniphilus oxalaticus]|uniref:Riboflavin biosynthesis protein RibD n=1 Tax=Ammoniphilus oxalaticus TaxID=66863 RepID=A0A419SKB5_9BACL|nr:bifunctional diaminohydroxyphosphoribosylaminopyrimidine deaminase/5-amino-6-(5-phosphoribosylamino)uracil reductase RibD [Ammoniphilus oxalaticus]RKD24379.1 riboflavin biosynthesis protein RibD [Ammoniphilus oxalaticus]
MDQHEYYMQKALQWADSPGGQTEPNPKVGALLVKEHEIIGIGAHLKAGGPHAEVHALRMAGERANGATLYVTLEPCSHVGRTSPCAEAVIQAGIKKVVIATLDPNPLVAGRGVKMLKQAGIEVISGICEQQSLQMNEIFNKYITTGKPFVTVKTASTLDGKVATQTGSSRWISGPRSRLEVHRMRHESRAILVGVGTVLQDNPELTTRLPEGGRNPIRVILDSRLRTPLDCKLVTDGQAPTWIYTTTQAPKEKMELLQAHGIDVFPVSSGPSVDLSKMLKHLAEQGIASLLVEGGSQVNGSFLKAKEIDKIVTFIAPKLVGGEDAPTSFGGEGVMEMGEAVLLKNMKFRQVGDDLRIDGYPIWEEGD